MAKTEAQLRKMTKAQLADELRKLNNAKFGPIASLSNMDEADLIRMVLDEQASTGGSTPPERVPAPKPKTTATADPNSLVCTRCKSYMAADVADLRDHFNNKCPALKATGATPPSDPSGSKSGSTPGTTPFGSDEDDELVDVPDVKGQTPEGAKHMANWDGLTVDDKNLHYIFTTETEEGLVHDQKPPFGARAKKGSEIKVQIAKKPPISPALVPAKTVKQPTTLVVEETNQDRGFVRGILRGLAGRNK